MNLEELKQLAESKFDVLKIRPGASFKLSEANGEGNHSE
jgi:hypothetical protein